MTTYNNYNQSSTGINIELTIYHDCDLARSYLDDFTQEPNVLVLRDRTTGCIDYIVLAPDLDEPYFTASALQRMNKQQLRDVLTALDYYNIDGYTKQELIETLQSLTIADYLTALHTYTPWANLPYTYNVYGYSQGDTCRVYDRYPQGKSLHDRECIHRLLWDAPIYGTLTVNGDEFYLEQYIDDHYDYDPDALLRNLANSGAISPEVLQQVADTLPHELEYL